MVKIKVLHYLRHLALGGTEKSCQLFYEHADTSKFEVCVAYEKNGHHPRMEEFEKACLINGGLLHEVDSYASGKFDGTDLQQVINAARIDIVHQYKSGYMESPEPGIDYVSKHTILTNVFGFYNPNLAIDRDLFMSKWLMDYCSQSVGFKSPRFDFVNNPVESPCTDAVLSISEKWHQEGAIIVGRCGRPDNGIYHSLNVDAVRFLRLQGYDIRFIVMAPPSNMLLDLLKYEIPFFSIEPNVNPVVLGTFYNSLDILVHARPDGESMGLNIAEAMVYGKPVVTHVAEPSFPGMGVFQAQCEVVSNNETGFVVGNDKAEYADALLKLVLDKDLRLEMGENGRQKALAEYHIDVCMKKLERIYEEVMS